MNVQGQHSGTKRTHAELAIALCVFVAGAVVVAASQLPRGSLCIGYSCGLTNLNVSYSLQHKRSENDTSLII